MSRMCTRPCCGLRFATAGRRCECGAATRAAIGLRIEAIGAAASSRWRFADPGRLVVGRLSRSNADDPPAVDLAPLLAETGSVSRRLLTVTWSGERAVRITRESERGEVVVDGAALAPRNGVERPLPACVVVNGFLKLQVVAEDV